jgi:hypothetical protein
LWNDVLTSSDVEVIVTTNPVSAWTTALLYAGRRLGKKTVHISQGFPTLIWQFSSCDLAIVWSEVGKKALYESGWSNAHTIARNPTIPSRENLQRLRELERCAMALREDHRCVLFLGQMSVDRIVEVNGYRRTCEMVGKGLAMALQSEDFIPMLRRHPREPTRETERLLLRHIPGLKVSEGKSLRQDLAVADITIGMHSAALEEAYLMSRPIVQAVADGFDLVLDFSVLGAYVARAPHELADLITSKREWELSTSLDRGPSVAEVVASLA